MWQTHSSVFSSYFFFMNDLRKKKMIKLCWFLQNYVQNITGILGSNSTNSEDLCFNDTTTKFGWFYRRNTWWNSNFPPFIFHQLVYCPITKYLTCGSCNRFYPTHIHTERVSMDTKKRLSRQPMKSPFFPKTENLKKHFIQTVSTCSKFNRTQKTNLQTWFLFLPHLWE